MYVTFPALNDNMTSKREKAKWKTIDSFFTKQVFQQKRKIYCILTSVICNLESCRLDISGYGGALSLLVTVETELACSLSSILSGKDSLEIGSSVEAILCEEFFVSVETPV
jgi:hypothetical protein